MLSNLELNVYEMWLEVNPVFKRLFRLCLRAMSINLCDGCFLNIFSKFEHLLSVVVFPLVCVAVVGSSPKNLKELKKIFSSHASN